MSLPAHHSTVVEDWIDYNGHLSEAYYVLIFGHATDQVMDHLGMDAAYRERTGCSLYTVEAHIRYLDEVPLGAELTVRSRIVSSGAKKLHLAHEMFHEHALCATEEILALHVGGEPAGALPFGEDIAAKIVAASDGAPAPEWSGRSIG